MITKAQARKAIEIFNYANARMAGKNQKYLIQESKDSYSYIKEIDNVFHYIYEEFDFIVDCNTIQLHDILTISGEVVSLDLLKSMIDDLTAEQQKQALETLDLTAVETYIKQRTDLQVKLHKKVYVNRQNKWCMDLYTDNIVQHAGVCKAMLKELYIDCTGIAFSIDRHTGEQFLWFPALHFSYVHIDNGTNGHEFGRVRYNNNKFEGYNYQTQKYEAI